MSPTKPQHSAYGRAGVSIEAGERAVELMREWVDKACRPEVVGGIGGFAGLFDASALKAYRRPLLATSADGVGTKVTIAQRLDKHDTIGFDLVGMLVDDLVVCGAEPLFLTDYIACGKVVPERIAAIVKGVAEACVQAGCALLGGETAEHPGLLDEHEYDVAGATTGVVEADDMLGPHRVRAGDFLVAMASSGLHSNGYSLVRAVFGDRSAWPLGQYVDGLGRTLGEELLEPTRIYARPALALARRPGTHAMAHVTGGGIAANLARVLPDSVSAVVERGSWDLSPVFDLVAEVGAATIGLDESDLEEALNMGVGMVTVVDADHADSAIALLADHGVRAWACGEVLAVPGGHADLVGTYRRAG